MLGLDLVLYFASISSFNNILLVFVHVGCVRAYNLECWNAIHFYSVFTVQSMCIGG